MENQNKEAISKLENYDYEKDFLNKFEEERKSIRDRIYNMRLYWSG